MKIEKGIEPVHPINPVHNNAPREEFHQKSSEEHPEKEEKKTEDSATRIKKAQDDLEKSGEEGWVA